jgi:predicted Zn-dependent protease with MMP-like domain
MSVGVDDGTGTVDFKREVEEALASLPRQLRDVISNVVILVDEEPRPGQPLLGLYQGIPYTTGTGYAGVLPDKITIYKRPLECL